MLAFEDREKHRLGSEEALEALDDKIRLQSWLNQVAQVEQLFEPLAEPLSRMHRMASDMNDVDGRDFTKMCTDEPEEPPPVVEAPPPVVESTALAVVPGSPADESYDFFGDASRPESPARIAWEPPPRAPPKRVYMPKRRTRRPIHWWPVYCHADCFFGGASGGGTCTVIRWASCGKQSSDASWFSIAPRAKASG